MASFVGAYPRIAFVMRSQYSPWFIQVSPSFRLYLALLREGSKIKGRAVGAVIFFIFSIPFRFGGFSFPLSVTYYSTFPEEIKMVFCTNRELIICLFFYVFFS